MAKIKIVDGHSAVSSWPNGKDLKDSLKPGDYLKDAPIIYSYTAAQGVEDGHFHDVTAEAKAIGFRVAVRLTAGVRALCDESENPDQTLSRILNLARLAINHSAVSLNDLIMSSKTPSFDIKVNRKAVTLWALPDTTSGPAIHILLPSEY